MGFQVYTPHGHTRLSGALRGPYFSDDESYVLECCFGRSDHAEHCEPHSQIFANSGQAYDLHHFYPVYLHDLELPEERPSNERKREDDDLVVSHGDMLPVHTAWRCFDSFNFLKRK